MAESVNENDTVSLNITHGLRHLPMLTVLSAMYLEVLKKVSIEGIYYGAFEMKHLHNDDVAPAVNLGGLLQIAKWVGALNSFDKDGDYSVFAEVLKDDGFSKADDLKKAAYFERIIDLERATKRLSRINNKIEEEGLPGIGGLFSKQLQERISWCQGDSSNEVRKVYAQQCQLARSYFEKRDYVRAANFALEGMTTRSLNPGDDPYNFSVRESAKKCVVAQSLDRENKGNYLLKEIRNQLAHGSYEKKIADDDPFKEKKRNTLREAKSLLENEQQLRSKLEALMNNLLKPLT
jgi:CRISPR-associated DxTHG motif protein